MGEPSARIQLGFWAGWCPDGSSRIISITTMIRSQASAPSLSATLLQGSDHFACFYDRLVAMPLKMHLRSAENI
jgi:hypothetical protein